MAFAARLLWRLAHEHVPEEKHPASALPASVAA
jgi:hypothetical protein